MKIIFEPEDFETGLGQMLVVNKAKIVEGYVYKTGFINFKEDPGIVYLLISMADGLSIQFDSIEEMCKSINRRGLRPMTQKEIALLGSRQYNRFNNEEAR